MLREKFDSARKRLGVPVGFFHALTLVVMIIIILTARELKTAILVIGLITNFLIIGAQLTLFSDRYSSESSQNLDLLDSASLAANPSPSAIIGDANLLANVSEGFTGATTAPPGPSPPAAVFLPPTGPAAEKYPGAIDFDESPLSQITDSAAAVGHSDWDEADRDSVPLGNPYDLGRIASPQAAGPCVDDDAVAVLDGDELMAYHGTARNDPERVWAAATRRKAFVGRYIREELDETENTRWWGDHEI